MSELFQYRELLLMLAWRDISIRYKQAVMGFLWAILMPVLIVGSGAIVTLGLSTVSGKPVNKLDMLSVSIKAIPWAFFVGAIRFATASLVSNKELVTKIYFPRQVLPIATVLAQVFDFGVALVAVTALLVIAQVGVSFQLLWVPLLLGILVLLTAGLAMLLSCANLFFRDVKYVVDVLLTYGIFFTPVFYTSATFGKWGVLMQVNPVGPILEGLTATILYHRPPDLPWVLYSASVAVVISVVSWRIFRRAEPLFAESV
jgi:lipopolysaccharide transport system permease protein